MLSKLTIAALLASIASAQPGGDRVWNRNAAWGEAETFDRCNGHQPLDGLYHYHLNPMCLRAQLNDNVVAVSTGRLGTQYAEKKEDWTHSPVLGWASDGYPVYGPYGYSTPTDPKSPIKRVQSSFRLRNITQRRTLPEWALPYHAPLRQNLNASQWGPDVSPGFPLGRYVEDYEYVAGLGDLDEYNGRFTVTPEYPQGTYAYFVTLSEDGVPAFPYVINVQFYGTPAMGAVPADAIEYFSGGRLTGQPSADPRLASWYTKGSLQPAQAINGFDPSAGAFSTWPQDVPPGVRYNGGVTTPTMGDTQRIRYDNRSVYLNSNNLPSYTIGPWFDAMGTGGVFVNWPAAQNLVVQIPRNPSPARNKIGSPLGVVGMWVNGVAIFNTLDGASYSNARRDDLGGGMVSPRAIHVSAASQERGPIAAGSLVTAYAEFGAILSTSTERANGPAWPLSLAGTTVTITDSSRARLTAGIVYAAPESVTYQMPSKAASGPAEVIITFSGRSVSGKVNILPTYPGIFLANGDHLAAAQTTTVDGDKVLTGSTSTTNATGEIVPVPIDLSSGQVYLTLFGTGIGAAPITATIGGVEATVSESTPLASMDGVDTVKLLIPSALAGKGRVGVVLTAGGKTSNPVYIVIQ